MNRPTMGNLEKRLNRLERENQRLKMGGWTLFITLLMVTLLGASHVGVSEEIRAKRFVLVDNSGKQRAVWDTNLRFRKEPHLWQDTDYAAALVFFDGNNQFRAVLGLEGDETPRVDLFGEKRGRRLASLNVSGSDVPALYLAGEDGIDRAWLEVAGNRPTLVFRDELRNQRMVLGAFQLWSTIKAQGQYIDLGGTSESRPTSSLVLIGEDGKVLWKAP